MTKIKNTSVWIEEGYKIYSQEGIEGMQIERLARILNLNKSGFYHYFGDLEGYLEELLKYHGEVANRYNEGLKKLNSIDPEYFQHVIDFKIAVMFNMQMIRMPDNHPYHIAAMQIDEKENVILAKLWSSYLGVEDNPELAVRYLDIMRSTFYGRINFKNYTLEYFRALVGECKEVINKLSEQLAKSEKISF